MEHSVHFSCLELQLYLTFGLYSFFTTTTFNLMSQLPQLTKHWVT
uniref:Uncharacterized protein n=1 Tax=Rhizophora mucronata TaxID=61149 RepID=A0A2P2PD17_RHIMU